ncbi:helix-turn-helix domain-containing protein [Bacteroides cellulolyticus]|uniref:helix-turn-helix domain-containing protein n=1 Tax=Bacteroides cellulolyticus TaxID=2981780 RepID=UPI0012ABDF13|nr:helix-turn-helix domain-containing protein [Bacteroides cellulolyticus]MCU6771574.1 helix-turn-helix domain-containing protein [Bacteroides cellulolyticus]
MNIKQIIESGANVQLIVNAVDLREAFLSLMQEVNLTENKKEETYLTASEVCSRLKIDKTTLWRWNRDGYLKKVKVGNKPYYRQSDIDKLREG